MDPGTALAVASLSFQVFGGIIKGFTLLAKAHNLGRDATLLQTMLRVEESRLIQWARAVELLEDSDLQSGGSDGNDIEHDTVTTQNDSGAISESSIVAHSVADEASLVQRYKLDLVEMPATLAGPNTTPLIEQTETATTVLEKLVPDTLRQRILFRENFVQQKSHLPKRLWWAAVDKQGVGTRRIRKT
ncbi:hypothetical protein ACHAP3_008434 [Botrytis cinerea]